jgi:transcriptional regulator of acetoin/glycerol metabolism
MISEATVDCITRLLQCDSAATEEERAVVLAALRGERSVRLLDAARMLRVSRTTVWRMVKDGVLSCQRLSVRESRIPLAQILAIQGGR